MNEIQSFEVTGGSASGDLLSERRGDRPLKVGLLACGYFEYWRMYAGLREQVAADMQAIADRLSGKHDLVYPGLVETLDGADQAGQRFREEHVDLLVIAEGTYCPDFFIHQALLHLSSTCRSWSSRPRRTTASTSRPGTTSRCATPGPWGWCS